MALAVIIALISWPIIEIVLLIKIGSAIGVLPLLLLLVGMAIAGGMMLRRQGLAVARRTMEQLSRNEPPVQAMIDGIGLTVAGFLFLVPGLIGDAVGLALLLPWIRRPLIGRLLGLASVRWDGFKNDEQGRNGAGRTERGDRPSPQNGPGRDGMVIEGEFERVEERTVKPGRGGAGGASGENPDSGAPPGGPRGGSPWQT